MSCLAELTFWSSIAVADIENLHTDGAEPHMSEREHSRRSRSHMSTAAADSQQPCKHRSRRIRCVSESRTPVHPPTWEKPVVGACAMTPQAADHAWDWRHPQHVLVRECGGGGALRAVKEICEEDEESTCHIRETNGAEMVSTAGEAQDEQRTAAWAEACLFVGGRGLVANSQ